MADEIVSQLSLDATRVLSAFKELQVAFASHTQSIQVAIQAISGFNRVEGQMAPAIDTVNQKLNEQKRFAAETANALRNVFTGRIDSTATIAEIKRVNDAFAALERTLTSTKASPSQVNQVLGNLKGQFTGTEAQIQSALIAAKNAADNLGSANAASTLKINQAAIKGRADALAQAEAAALAKSQATASQQVAQSFAGQFQTLGADPGALNRFQASVQRFQQVAQKSGLSTDQLRNVVGNLGNVFTGAEGRVSQAALSVQRFGQALTGVQTTASGFGANFQSLLKVFTFQQALQGLGALQQAFTGAISGAIAFERQLAQISTISDAGDKNLDTLGVRVANLAIEFGKPAPEVAAGFYQALSNQVGDTGQTVQFLTEALKFSKAAVTDVGSSVDALSAVQNAYGQSSTTASHNADVLFRTIDLGRVSAKELGDSFGRILPIAAQLGVSLEEVSAAISTATVQGVKFQDAQTQILNLLIASLKPTGDFKKRMDELGFSSTNAGIAAEGFVGFFSKIGEAAKGSEELAKLFPNIRGLRGEISLFGDSGKRLTDFLEQTKNSAGAAQDAFNRIQFSNAEQVSNELTRIQTILVQGFGRDAVAALNVLRTSFGLTADKVVFFGEAITAAFALGVVFTAGNQLVALLGSIGTAFGTSAGAATKFGLVATAAVVAFIATVKAFQATDFAQQTIDGLEKLRVENAKVATEAANAFRESDTNIRKGIEDQVSDLLKAQQQKQAALNSAFAGAAAVESATTDNFKTEVSQRLRAYNNFLNSVKALQDNAAEHAKTLQQKQIEFSASIQESRFQNNLSTKTPEQQAIALNQQINKLLSQGSIAQANGQSGFAEKQVEQAKQLALEFEKMTGNRTLTSKVEQAYAALLAQEGQSMRAQVADAQKLEQTNLKAIETARTQLELALELDKQREKLVQKGEGGSDEAKALEKQIASAIDKANAAQKQLNLGTQSVQKSGPQTQNQLQSALDALRKINTGPDLKFTFQKGIDDFRAEVKRQFEANPIVIKLGLQFDEKGTSDIQAQLAKLKDVALKGRDEQGGLKGLTDTVNTERTGLFDALKDIGKNAKDAFGASFSLDITPFKKVTDVAQKASDDLKAFFANRDTNFNAETGKLTEEGAKNLKAITEPLVTLRKAFTDNKEGINELLGNFAGASEKSTQLALDQITKLIKAQETLASAQQKVKEGEAAQGQLDKASAGQPLDKQQQGQGKTETDTRKADIEDKNSLQTKQQLRDIEKELGDAVTQTTNTVQLDAKLQASAFSEVSTAADQLAISIKSIPPIQETGNAQAISALAQNLTSSETAAIGLNQEVSLLGPNGLNAGESAASGISIIGATAESQIGGVVALTDALIALAEAQAAAGGGGGGGGGEFASRGAFIQHFASGGQARGTDTVPAMLTPGEVVMNPHASRKFFSTLMAMNAGVQPSFRSNGGQVGDSFGDINVNIHSNGPSDINARAIAQGIQRELRRRSIK